MEQAIYCTKTNQIIDLVKSDANAALAALQPKYGDDLVVLPFDDAWKRHEDAAKTPPIEIDEDAWMYALEVLPPAGWKHADGGEVFKCSERLTGAITAIYVRIDDRYFTFNDDIRLPAVECVKRVRDALL
jgi:hypothetical protein